MFRFYRVLGLLPPVAASRPPTLPADLAATVARAGVNPDFSGRVLQEALTNAIGVCHGFLGDQRPYGDGWRVELRYPSHDVFCGPTPEIALARCLAALVANQPDTDACPH